MCPSTGLRKRSFLISYLPLSHVVDPPGTPMKGVLRVSLTLLVGTNSLFPPGCLRGSLSTMHGFAVVSMNLGSDYNSSVFHTVVHSLSLHLISQVSKMISIPSPPRISACAAGNFWKTTTPFQTYVAIS